MEAPHAYTIKDQVEFSVKVEELVDGEWQPYRWAAGMLTFAQVVTSADPDPIHAISHTSAFRKFPLTDPVMNAS